MEVRFEYHYVLFLDILGYRDLIVRAASSPSDDVRSIKTLHDGFSDAKVKYDALDGFEIKQFSDSIILSAPYAAVSADLFLNESADLQLSLIRHGILTRGGIAVGKHFQSQDFVASQGVIDAYEIEQGVAKFPRIVVTENFLNLAYPSGDLSGVPLAKFVDGATFVDFLRRDQDPEVTRRALAEIWSSSGSLLWPAREKVSWLVEYWNAVHIQLEITMPSRFDFT
jgi:hypothetical protein